MSFYWSRVGVVAGMAAALGLISTVGSAAPLAKTKTPVARGEFLDFHAVMNRALRDPVAGDRQGGWTDEGPGRDMSSLPTGTLAVGPIAFTVADPATNNSNGCLVLAGPGQESLPRHAELPVSSAPAWKYFYLLHATAFALAENTGDSTTVGTVVIDYTDGSTQRDEIVLGRDVGDWTQPDPLPNGRVAWKSGTSAGLFASRFELSGKPVARVRLESTGAALWLIVAATGATQDWEGARAGGETIAAGEEWVPYRQLLDIEPGSVFDRSSIIDAPAGKYGPAVITPQGHFEFRDRPGVRARFWGINTGFDVNFPDKAQADALSRRLALSGYNTIRLHHYDGRLLKKGSSWEFDPEQLDRLDYFFAALKKQGLYINIDLFSSNRNFSAADVPELGINPGPERLIKRLVPVSDNAFQAWGRFARALLTHKNPYTGLTWAEDPAIIGICPLNEDTIFELYNRNGPPEMLKLYNDVFARWQAEAPSNARRTGESEDSHRIRFLTDISIRSHRQITEYLRSLGYSGPVTGSNYRSSQALTLIRSAYDYVDNHDYWNHPVFPEKRWTLPVKANQKSSLKTGVWLPGHLMATRVFGKPFTVTEFNYVWPNAARAEGGALIAAYSLLQDWDALYNFNYAESQERAFTVQPSRFFDLTTDPIGLLADRFSALIFRREEIAPAAPAVVFAVEEKNAFSGDVGRPRELPKAFSDLGFVARIGSRPESQLAVDSALGIRAVVTETSETGHDGKSGLPRFAATPELAGQLADAGILPREAINKKTGRFTASGGAVEWLGNKGSFALRTPYTEGFVLPAGQSLSGERVSIQNGRTFAAVYVTSADGLPLAESRRLLVLHLTDSLNTGSRFRDSGHTLLDAWGALPHLVRKGEAELSLRLPDGDWTAWAVDASGKRLGTVPLSQKNGGWNLHASTNHDGRGVLAYELAR